MRTVLASCLLFAAPAMAAPAQAVDLNKPGALEALQAERPDHYSQVMEHVRAMKSHVCTTPPKTMHVKPTPEQSACEMRMLSTSFPAKASLSLPVDDVVYRITVSIDSDGYRLRPAR